jgi:HK97 family phage prohead protease
MREKRQIRAVSTDFQTREENDTPHITGYFAVFNSTYEIGSGMTESIAPGAFAGTLAGDIRALVNHDSTLVLGRTKAHTLELKEDERGLWGDITINPEDRDAMNLYERVKRGDVDQCSFGFDIVSEDTDYKDDGSIHWTITEVRLYEVSCCTFPAYEQTNISARSAERDAIRARSLEAWKTRMKGVLKNGTESPAAE